MAAVEEKVDSLEEAATVEEEVDGLDEEEDEELTLLPQEGEPAFKIQKSYCTLSTFITTILKGDETATEIEVKQVSAETLKHIVEYLEEHKGKVPADLPCPVRSTQMDKIVSHPWDATFIDKFEKKTIFEIILGANYMDIKSLLHLGCAKIATLIKQLDQKEINRIIEEEEKWQKDHSAAGEDEAKTEEAA